MLPRIKRPRKGLRGPPRRHRSCAGSSFNQTVGSALTGACGRMTRGLDEMRPSRQDPSLIRRAPRTYPLSRLAARPAPRPSRLVPGRVMRAPSLLPGLHPDRRSGRVSPPCASVQRAAAWRRFPNCISLASSRTDPHVHNGAGRARPASSLSNAHSTGWLDTRTQTAAGTAASRATRMEARQRETTTLRCTALQAKPASASAHTGKPIRRSRPWRS